MSKRKSRTKPGTKRRYQRKNTSGLKARLVHTLRRFGKISALCITVLWLGVWLALSGTFERMGHGLTTQLYDMSARHGFALENLYVEGRVNADDDVLKAIVNIERGDPIFLFDTDQAKEMIDRIAWVKESHVERRLPNTIYISLLEREPVALWQYQGKVRLIDREGEILTSTPPQKYKDLMLVVGDRNAISHLDSFVDILSAERWIYDQIDSIQYRGKRRWDMSLKNGLVVKLPEEDVETAFMRLRQSQDEHGILQKDIVSIDLRHADRLTVKTRPGQVQDFHRLINASSSDKAI